MTVGEGETVGLVGESGSGKSITARALMGLLPPSVAADGAVVFRDRNLLELPEREMRRLRGTAVSLLLQDPFTMLNPLMKVRRSQITEARAGASRAEREGRSDPPAGEVGIDSPPSPTVAVPALGRDAPAGRDRRRARERPRVLIADEPSTALDVTTQKEILALPRCVQGSRGMGLVLITHDLRVAFAMCDRIYVLLRRVGDRARTVRRDRAKATPSVHARAPELGTGRGPGSRELRAIPGNMPRPDDVAGQCSFAPRCAFSAPKCLAGDPPLLERGGLRATACVRVDEIEQELRRSREVEDAAVATSRPDRTTGSLLEVVGLKKYFRAVKAVDGVSLHVAPGESVGVVGESGSGKTTLARCIAGLETPTAGEIVTDGISVAGASASNRRQVRGVVQMVFQDPYSSLNPSMKVGSALKEVLWAARRGSRGIYGSVHELLDRVGLPAEYANRKPAQLSGGERQRVAIARALALNPRLIICDEPVSALDVSVQAQILNLFKQLGEELDVAYLFITHDLGVVRQVADRLYVMRKGEIVEEGAVDDVLASPSHEYTQMLIDSVPRSDDTWLQTTTASGKGAA